jgi:hypothetical protein
MVAGPGSVAGAEPEGPAPLVAGQPLPFPVVPETEPKAPPFISPVELPQDMVYLTSPGLLSGAPHTNLLRRPSANFESVTLRRSEIEPRKVTIPAGALTYLTEPASGASPMVQDALFFDGKPRTVIDFSQSIAVRRNLELPPGGSAVVGGAVLVHGPGVALTSTYAAVVNLVAVSGLDLAWAGTGSLSLSTTQPGWGADTFRQALYQGKVEEVSPRSGVRFAWISATRMDEIVLADKHEFGAKLKTGGEIPLSTGGKITVNKVDGAAKRIELSTPDGPMVIDANFDWKLLIEDTAARRKVVLLGKTFAVYLIPFFSDFESGEVHLEAFTGLIRIKNGEPFPLDPAWRAYPIGCYTGHNSGVYLVNDKPIELSPEKAVVTGPQGAFKLVTRWSAAGELTSFGIEDRTGKASAQMPAKGRKSINFLAGDGPTLFSLMRFVGLPVVTQMYGMLTGQEIKAPAVMMAAPASGAAGKAAAAVDPTSAAANPELPLRFKLTWALIGGLIAVIGAFGVGSLRRS